MLRLRRRGGALQDTLQPRREQPPVILSVIPDVFPPVICSRSRKPSCRYLIR